MSGLNILTFQTLCTNTIEYSDQTSPPSKTVFFAQKQQGLIHTHSFLNLTKFVIFITFWSILKYKPTSAV